VKNLCVVVDVLAHLLSNEAAKSLLMDITIVVSSLVVCVALIHAFAFREATRRKASEEEKNIRRRFFLRVVCFLSEEEISTCRGNKSEENFFQQHKQKAKTKKLFPTKKNERKKNTSTNYLFSRPKATRCRAT
tara:strand:- start:1685 stop:2083 length:399 start_codon:yes stop_codon:yes gene_type:complete